MKIIITGSLPHISQPLTMELAQKGHSVTVISRRTERQKEEDCYRSQPTLGKVKLANFAKDFALDYNQ